MAATTVGLFYSATTGRLRWWMVPDNDQQLASFVPPNPGEAGIIISQDQYLAAGDPSGLQALVNTASGKSPTTEDRFADVDAGGNVTSIVYACPSCGDVAALGITRTQHATAERGDLLIGGLLFSPRPRARRRAWFRRRILAS